jgi:dihydroorotase
MGLRMGGELWNLVKEEWRLEDCMEFGEDMVKPLRAGEMVTWKIVR